MLEKKRGRKRFILVDVLGNVLARLVVPANVTERNGFKQLIEQIKDEPFAQNIRVIYADGGFSGRKLRRWFKRRMPHCKLKIVKRSDKQKGWVVLAKRWIVERTFAWFNLNRRLLREFEYWEKTSEAMINIAQIRILVRRIAHPIAQNTT